MFEQKWLSCKNTTAAFMPCILARTRERFSGIFRSLAFREINLRVMCFVLVLSGAMVNGDILISNESFPGEGSKRG